MSAYLVLLLAVLSRFLPHAVHEVSWNFTALGGGLLFFGSRLGSGTQQPSRIAARLVGGLAILMAADYALTTFVYQYPFHAQAYLVTWAWYAVVCVLGMGLLAKPSLLRVSAGVLASATSFFLVSNFVVWAGSAMYAHTLAGLGDCYLAAMPFYRNDLASTALTAGALFGLPELAARIYENLHPVQSNIAA